MSTWYLKKDPDLFQFFVVVHNRSQLHGNCECTILSAWFESLPYCSFLESVLWSFCIKAQNVHWNSKQVSPTFFADRRRESLLIQQLEALRVKSSYLIRPLKQEDEFNNKKGPSRKKKWKIEIKHNKRQQNKAKCFVLCVCVCLQGKESE